MTKCNLNFISDPASKSLTIRTGPCVWSLRQDATYGLGAYMLTMQGFEGFISAKDDTDAVKGMANEMIAAVTVIDRCARRILEQQTADKQPSEQEPSEQQPIPHAEVTYSRLGGEQVAAKRIAELEAENDRLRKAIAGNLGPNGLCHTDSIERLEQVCIDAGQMAWNLGNRVVESDELHEAEVERLQQQLSVEQNRSGHLEADVKELRQDLEEVNEFVRSLGYGQGAIDNGLVDCLRESFAKYEQLRHDAELCRKLRESLKTTVPRKHPEIYFTSFQGFDSPTQAMEYNYILASIQEPKT